MGGDGGRVAIHDDSADFTWSWAIKEMSRYYGKCHAILEKKSITGERPFSRWSQTPSQHTAESVPKERVDQQDSRVFIHFL
jgi:hypothetical protein